MARCVLQGKPAQVKGQDRLGGRSRIKVEEENIYLYLSEVCGVGEWGVALGCVDKGCVSVALPAETPG